MRALPRTAIEFADAGVAFVPSGGLLEVYGPKGATALADALELSVDARVASLRTMPHSRERGDSRCDGCGDPLLAGRGGICALCCLARQRIIGAAGANGGTHA